MRVRWRRDRSRRSRICPYGRQARAVDECEVGLGDSAFGRRRGTGVLCAGFCPRDHHGAGCVLVQTVDDPGAVAARQRRQIAQVVGECVGEGVPRLTVAGMDREAGGLVHDQQMLVLEQDVEGQVLGLEVGGRRGGDVDPDAFAAFHAATGLQGVVPGTHVDVAGANPSGQHRPAELGQGRSRARRRGAGPPQRPPGPARCGFLGIPGREWGHSDLVAVNGGRSPPTILP